MADGKATTARVRVLGRSSLCKSGPLSIRSRALPSAVRDRTSTAQHISPGCDFGRSAALPTSCAITRTHTPPRHGYGPTVSAQCSAVPFRSCADRPTLQWPRESSLLRSRQAGLPPRPEWLGRTAAAATRPCASAVLRCDPAHACARSAVHSAAPSGRNATHRTAGIAPPPGPLEAELRSGFSPMLLAMMSPDLLRCADTAHA